MKSKFIRLLVIIIGLVVALFGFFVINEKINSSRESSFRFTYDSSAYAYQVDSIRIDGKEAIIEGWFIDIDTVRNENRKIGNDLSVLLFDYNSPEEKDYDGNLKPYKGIVLKTERTVRNDVNGYFKCEKDYSKCGFVAKCDLSEIDLDNRKYQVVFKADKEDDYAIPSSTYIEKGKVCYVKPENSMSLDSQDPVVGDVITGGVCVMTLPEYNICVFQYQDMLYWIGSNEFLLEEDGTTHIQYEIDTTQYERLPEKDRTNYYASEDFYFEDNMIVDQSGSGKYKVAVREIPKDYSIVGIHTGYCTYETTVWEGFFRPVYHFDS